MSLSEENSVLPFLHLFSSFLKEIIIIKNYIYTTNESR